jgi:predicted O-methyltransferase YrrM
MVESPDTEIIDGSTFELRPFHRNPSNRDWVCLRKNREATDRYLELAPEFRQCRMVEVGVDRGGSTAFFTKLLQPEKLVALELSNQPVKFISDFLAEHDKEGRVSINWGVDQSDRRIVPGILERAFGRNRLDLVVDDASHMLAPSTATFEMLFPRLRPGGLYVLEDWSGSHQWERRVDLAVEKDAGGQLSEKFLANAREHPEKESPMSVLICQLVIAAGRNPAWVSSVRVIDGLCEVRRGDGDIPPDASIRDYVGALGHWMFESHTG